MRLAELGGFAGAFACNARGQQPLASIDDHRFGAAVPWLALLEQALETQAWQPL
ncbi:hypothetical protein HH299_10740 [Xanthomonas sp. Kuri4-2]